MRKYAIKVRKMVVTLTHPVNKFDRVHIFLMHETLTLHYTKKLQKIRENPRNDELQAPKMSGTALAGATSIDQLDSGLR
jgi:hypothetical protein